MPILLTLMSAALALPWPFRSEPPSLAEEDDTNTLVLLPLKEAEGLALQVWLSRTPFQPGSIDGHPGANTWHALRAFQRSEGLPDTGRPDPKTRAALREAAHADPRPVVRRHVLTAEDVAGPYVQLPEGLYDAHESPCMCYRSPWEEVAERFQVSPKLLAALNPDTNLDALAPGVALVVPDPRPVRPLDTPVAAIRIDVDEMTLSAQDDAGNVLRQYPTVVGDTFAAYRGGMTVANVSWDPDYNLDPDKWEEIPDSLPKVVIPPGPNSPVGVVWMGLSEDGFGIHGTSDPETIGHTESHGCVRLTNWSATELAEHVQRGKTEVRFVGLDRG
ncbi:MAG: L,D-transpeptidase [Pseudomonadota bacterium]|nr:L,D-transpeptidase [Pseudomonadota bacterium]